MSNCQLVHKDTHIGILFILLCTNTFFFGVCSKKWNKCFHIHVMKLYQMNINSYSLVQCYVVFCLLFEGMIVKFVWILFPILESKYCLNITIPVSSGLREILWQEQANIEKSVLLDKKCVLCTYIR